MTPPLKVLLADDSILVRERLAAQVARIEGVEVVAQTGDVPTTLETIQKLAPDVVILDIRMPGGSGIQILETVKTERPALTAIMLTAYPLPQYRERCLESGADFIQSLFENIGIRGNQ